MRFVLRYRHLLFFNSCRWPVVIPSMNAAPPVTAVSGSTRSSTTCQSNLLSCSPIDNIHHRLVQHPTASASAMPPPIGAPFASNTTNSTSHHHHSHTHHSNMAAVAAQPKTQAVGSIGSNAVLKNSAPSAAKGRRLLIVRHGERVDFTFNASHENWVSKAFDAQGRYKRFNINMPRTLPTRKDGYSAYATDTPLTEIGYLQAKLTGRALKEAGIKPSHVYVSPAYRSVQTCVGILKGLQSQSQNVSFNIEPGLFEWGAWFRPKLPSWMTPDEYASQGYPVNVHYKPVVARTEITASETLTDYYNRSYKVVQRVLERHREDSTILLVAHGASLDTCTRQICGGPPRSQQEFYALLHQTPYLAMASMAEDAATRTFRLAEPPILPFQHQGNASYDWRPLTAVLGDKG